MPAATADFLTLPASFPHWARDTLRYGDTDRQGHVNNAVFATFCETGRARLLLDSPVAAQMPASGAIVIARLTLDYRAEIIWPGEVEIGTVVLGLGRSSITLGTGVFKEGVCAATAEAVVVLTDTGTRRSMPLPDGLRESLARLGRAHQPSPREV